MSTIPTADQVAEAIVAACRLTGEDPVALAKGARNMRARHVACEALREAFPDANRTMLGRLCAYPLPKNALVLINSAKNARWWNDEWVDEIVGVLVAETYGDQAE